MEDNLTSADPLTNGSRVDLVSLVSVIRGMKQGYDHNLPTNTADLGADLARINIESTMELTIKLVLYDIVECFQQEEH